MQKKVWFFGKHLNINNINFDKSDFHQEVKQALEKYLGNNSTIEIKTSGSTGKPKQISLNKTAMKASALKTLEALHLKPKQKCLLCLSPSRVGGLMMLVRWLEGDLDLYLQEPNSNPLQDLEHRIHLTSLVPYQLEHSKKHLHKVNCILVGGAAVSAGLEAEVKDITTLYHTYGMTETISHIALRKFGEPSFKAIKGVELDLDRRGCLIISAPYLGIKNLITNDVVELLTPNSFTWKGRYDNVVNSGGIKLFPEQLEAKLGDIGIPYFFAGMPDELFGEKLIMVLGTPIRHEQKKVLHTKMRDALGKYEKPKALYSVSELKFTSNNKLLRNLSNYTLITLD